MSNKPKYALLFLYVIVCVYFVINSVIALIIMDGMDTRFLSQLSIAQVAFSTWLITLYAVGVYKKWFTMPSYKSIQMQNSNTDDVFGWDEHDASRGSSIYV